MSDLEFYLKRLSARRYLREARERIAVVQAMEYRLDEMDEIKLNQITDAAKDIIVACERARMKCD